MKRGLLIIAVLGIVVIGGYIAFRVVSSRPLSPPQTIRYSYNGLDLKLIYCRPSKKGRVIFGELKEGALVPNGKYWRLGANEATEITLSKDVTVEGKPLKAGSYRLYAVPGEKSWEISFNSELGAWGYNEPDFSKDILKVNVPVEQVSSVTEQFTLTFGADPAGVNLNLDWDKTHLRIPFLVQ